MKIMYFNNEIISSIKHQTDQLDECAQDESNNLGIADRYHDDIHRKNEDTENLTRAISSVTLATDSIRHHANQNRNEFRVSGHGDCQLQGSSSFENKNEVISHDMLEPTNIPDLPDVPLEELLAYYRYIQASVAESLLETSYANSQVPNAASTQNIQSDNFDSTISIPQMGNVGIFTENENLSSDKIENIQDLKEARIEEKDMDKAKEKIRANVILELINSERDFVKHLKDVIEGYLYPARRHPEMFEPERIVNIFANIESLYSFQCEFLEQLESCINWNNLAASEVGQCFLDYERGFDVYHEYCNNHPNAISELQDLFVKQRYARFFEACRLLRSMIDISLDGFLLTPIQKICKYPLQLSELLKNTPNTHNDYVPVVNALETMRRCANLANERKRRIEALADLIAFQSKCEVWFGPKLWETSSILIHSGEVTKMTSHTWSQGVYLYLFDHLLLYFKKDILKRNSLQLRGRICMDDVIEIADVEEYKVRKSFKLYCRKQQKWFVFTTRNQREKEKWLEAFERERKIVASDKNENQGFQVTERELSIARRALQCNMNRTRSARYRSVRREKLSSTVVDHLDLDTSATTAGKMSRTLSLPSCIHPSYVMNFVDESRLITTNNHNHIQHNQLQPIGLLAQRLAKRSQPVSSSNTSNNNGGNNNDAQSDSTGWFKKMGSKKVSKSARPVQLHPVGHITTKQSKFVNSINANTNISRDGVSDGLTRVVSACDARISNALINNHIVPMITVTSNNNFYQDKFHDMHASSTDTYFGHHAPKFSNQEIRSDNQQCYGTPTSITACNNLVPRNSFDVTANDMEKRNIDDHRDSVLDNNREQFSGVNSEFIVRTDRICHVKEDTV